MPKPIFIVKIPINDPSLNFDAMDGITKKLQDQMPDYHVLTIGDKRKRGGVRFECYNTSDLDTVSFEYLKWMVSELK